MMNFIPLIFSSMKEIALSMLFKISFKAVAERFMTRLVIYSLNKLKDYSTNEVVDETVSDIIKQLEGKKLVVIEEEIKQK